MKSLMRNSAVVFLALVIAGAVTFCVSTQTMAMPHDAENIATHAGTLTSATINTIVLVVVAMTLLVVALASVRHEQKSGVATTYTYEGIASIIEKKIFHWLAIFERSPNTIKTA